MFKKLAFLLPICAFVAAGNAQADNVEIYLADMLDTK